MKYDTKRYTIDKERDGDDWLYSINCKDGYMFVDGCHTQCCTYEELSMAIGEIVEEQKETTMEFNEELKQLIADTGKSAKAIAEELEIPFRTFQNWYLGVRIPDKFTMNQLRKELQKMGESR